MTPVGHPQDHDTPIRDGPAVPGTSRPKPVAQRRVGYVAAATVNGIILWVANSLLGWGWPPFLTGEFDQLLPWIDASLAVTIAVNLLWVFHDPAWLRHLGQIGLDLLSIVVTVRTWQIFPFDFKGYWSGWEILARIAIAVGFCGLIVDTITRSVALARTAQASGQWRRAT